MNLEEGVGVSLVNKVPEELMFATLSGIDVHFTRTAASEVLELTVRDIQVNKHTFHKSRPCAPEIIAFLFQTDAFHLFQVDNQLLGSTHPVMLCVTPASNESGAVDSGPALQVNAVKVPSNLMLTDLFKVKH